MVLTSWEVRKPSKACRKGTRLARVAAWATAAMSMASWTEFENSIANPVARQAITSEWSPKIDRPLTASDRAAMWKTVLVSSPAILYMLGIIKSRPWLAVKVVVRAPVCSEPCTVPAAPPSDCISWTMGIAPHRLTFFSAAHWSANSPIGEEGVIG